MAEGQRVDLRLGGGKLGSQATDLLENELLQRLGRRRGRLQNVGGLPERAELILVGLPLGRLGGCWLS